MTDCQACGVPTDSPPEITAAHRVYLYAFTMFLRTGDIEERAALRSIMRQAAADAGIRLRDAAR